MGGRRCVGASVRWRSHNCDNMQVRWHFFLDEVGFGFGHRHGGKDLNGATSLV